MNPAIATVPTRADFDTASSAIFDIETRMPWNCDHRREFFRARLSLTEAWTNLERARRRHEEAMSVVLGSAPVARGEEIAA